MANLSHQPNVDVSRLSREVGRDVANLERLALKVAELRLVPWPFGRVSSGRMTSVEIPAEGAVPGRLAFACVAEATSSGCLFFAEVSARGLVRVTCFNTGPLAADLAQKNLRVLVEQ